MKAQIIWLVSMTILGIGVTLILREGDFIFWWIVAIGFWLFVLGQAIWLFR